MKKKKNITQYTLSEIQKSASDSDWKRVDKNTSNRVLTHEELKKAKDLLCKIRLDIKSLSEGDDDLLFAYRRKIYKELTYDERCKPHYRKKLKEKKWHEQKEQCAFCNQKMEMQYAELDRLVAAKGYTLENTRLVHRDCHIQSQARRGYI